MNKKQLNEWAERIVGIVCEELRKNPDPDLATESHANQPLPRLADNRSFTPQLICPYCENSLGESNDLNTRRREDHIKFQCHMYKRQLKKQNQRNLQPLPPARVIGQAGIPTLGKRRP